MAGLDYSEAFALALAENSVVQEVVANAKTLKELPEGEQNFAAYLAVAGVDDGPIKEIADVIDKVKALPPDQKLSFKEYLALVKITKGALFNQAAAIDQLLIDIKD